MCFAVSTSLSLLDPEKQWQRKNQSSKTTSAKHDMGNERNEQRPEQAEPPSRTALRTREGDSIHTCSQWVQAKCSVQARIIHSRRVDAAVSTTPSCPCLSQLGRGSNLSISFRSSTVSFFQCLLSMGAKLHPCTVTQASSQKIFSRKQL